MLIESLFNVGFLMMSKSVSVRKSFPTDIAFIGFAFNVDLLVSIEDAFSFEHFPTIGAFVLMGRRFGLGLLNLREGPFAGSPLPLATAFVGSAFWVDLLMPPEVIMGCVGSFAAGALIPPVLQRGVQLASRQFSFPKDLLMGDISMIQALMVRKASRVSEDLPAIRARVEIFLHFCLWLHRQLRVGADGFPTVKACLALQIYVVDLVPGDFLFEDGPFPCLFALLLLHVHPPVVGKAFLIPEPSSAIRAHVDIPCIVSSIHSMRQTCSKMRFVF